MAAMRPPIGSPERPVVAPEHVLRLHRAMSNDEFMTDADLLHFVAKHGLPFSEELLLSMFAEANASGDGLMDAEQLGKAVSSKFPYRQHNEDWQHLFDLAPRPEGYAAPARITALSPRALEQEPIRANFEQEPDILTFRPVTNTDASRVLLTGSQYGAGSPRGAGCMTASQLSCASFSTQPATFSSSAIFNTAHSLPARKGATEAAHSGVERAEEEEINRRVRPDSWYPTTPASQPPSAADVLQRPPGVEVASFDTPGRGGEAPLRFGFEACSAFDRSVETLSRTSAGAGWRTRGSEWMASQTRVPTQQPLLYGLHPRDFAYVPGGKADHIPLRVDGSVCRETGVPAPPPLRLLQCENSRHGLANSRAHNSAEHPARADGSQGEPFVSVFAKPSNLPLKVQAAKDRYEVTSGTEDAPAICYLNGKPDPHEFRPSKPDPAKLPPGQPRFRISDLGRHWPVREGMPASLLRQANPPYTCAPLRLALTENDHPGARSNRTDVRA
jgi:hypothetical protein